MMSRQLKAVIVDTDQASISNLEKFALDNSQLVEICGSASSIHQAISIIVDHKCDIVFINPTAANLDKLKLLSTLDFAPPKTVFISKNKEKAYDAFKFRAVDFILKPFISGDVFLSLYAISKLIDMELALQNEKIIEINSINALYQNKEYLSIGSMDKIELIKISDIIYCKADGKYTEFTLVDGSTLLSSKNLGEYQSILGEAFFYRIHHSYIINIKHIKRITKTDGLYCKFVNGEKLPIAKRRQEGFGKFINL